ncbi:MAG TPA: BtrH N-terminal domain-containing protein [Ktedonobacteraceae bacterium]|nr:BtrH N-terminal domain-containing protein [Ktedonobacteraceae bacterium]HVU69864.1 BtrH N-terminal domain-containing protein [Ktedonobacteraceae bacterium]
MAVPMVPYEGRMSYCLIRSLQMVLAYQGHPYPVPWLECVSGEPFGFAYVRNGNTLLAVVGYEYHLAGEHLLRTLNYEYTYTGAADDAAALASLAEKLAAGPVVAGMLDMGYLTYMPEHRELHGSDHAIVVLALRSDDVLVHDPAGYVSVPLPLSDFLDAWKRDIYTGKPYGLWQIGAQGRPPTEDEIWEKTLARARANYTREAQVLPGGIKLLYGPQAIRTLAADLQAEPELGIGSLPYFSWRVSAQRCLDSAFFLRARLPRAADIRWEQCQLYGQLQLASAASDRAALPPLLERLADREAALITALA